MHKVGNPYKIYDRTYIDPENKTLVSDKEIIDKKLRKTVFNIVHVLIQPTFIFSS